jgi:hypothetical protein
MPVIRVDDEVWNRLKSHARPLEDTPNSVMRRLLGIDEDNPEATASATPPRERGVHPPTTELGMGRLRRSPSTPPVRTNSGRALNAEWQVDARHALYHKDGTWYTHLRQFPGALFDPNGYVMFQTEAEYNNSPGLQHGVQLAVPNGIASLPGYVRVR